MVMDAGLARSAWNWAPATPLQELLREVAQHAEAHPEWLDLSAD